jgi:hypothetical protein
MDEGKDATSNGLWAVFVLIGITIIGLTLCWERIWTNNANAYEVLSALFGGLAFAGVILAILLQKRELELQRRELTLTREELRRSAIAQEQLNDANDRPYVKVQLLPNRYNSWKLVVGNVGRSPAENLKLTSSADMVCDAYENIFLNQLPVFSGVGFTLTSGQTLVYEIPEFYEPGNAPAVAQPSEFKIVASYTRHEKNYKDEYLLNKDLAKCTTSESGNDAGQIPEKLDKIAESLRDLKRSVGGGGFGRV